MALNYGISNLLQFTEHVGRNFQPNYITAWRKAALIFMTHSLWGGWHHVEVHDSNWWITRMEAMGFQYSEILTKEMRDQASKDSKRMDFTRKIKEGGKQVNAGQHLRGTLLVKEISVYDFANQLYSYSFYLFSFYFVGIHQSSCCISDRACTFVC